MVELNISSSDTNQRLNKFLLKYLNTAPSSFVYKMLRKKNITLNGKKAAGDEILKEGDIIKLFLSDETISKFRDNKESIVKTIDKNTYDSLKVLYVDENIIAVSKGAGILSQKAKIDDISINEMIIEYCRVNNLSKSGYTPSICNRLDRNTSGIILGGITLHGSQYLSEVLRTRKCDKFYYTVVSGEFKDSIHCKTYITKDENKNISQVISNQEYEALSEIDKENYSYAETIFTPVYTGKYSLLKIKLITGKSHQIRASLKYLGYPVVGDGKYGTPSVNRYFRDKYKLKHHLLHSGIICFDNIQIKDELPDIFIKICQGEGIHYKNLF